MIECTLQKMREHGDLVPRKSKERLRYGRYMHSAFPIEGIEKKKWVVGVHIDIPEYETLRSEKTVEEIAKECIEFLNTPPQNKRGRKRTKPLYATFEEVPYRIYEKRDGYGKVFLQALLVISDRRNRSFWSSGERTLSSKKDKKALDN